MSQLQLFDIDIIEPLYEPNPYGPWPAPFRSKEGHTYCCNPDCRLPLSQADHIWAWRGNCYCSKDCAHTLKWPDPIAQETFRQYLAEIRARRLQI